MEANIEYQNAFLIMSFITIPKKYECVSTTIFTCAKQCSSVARQPCCYGKMPKADIGPASRNVLQV